MTNVFLRSVNRRILFLSVILTAVFASIIIRLYYIQKIQRVFFYELAKDQQVRKIPVPAKRGEIFDRNGKPLAINIDVDSIYIDPAFVEDPQLCASTLSKLLNVDGKKLLQTLLDKKALKKSAFIWVKRRVDKEVSEKVKQCKLKGVYFQEEQKRIYPKEEMLSHVLGFVGVDNVGLDGLEKTMNKELSGEDGWKIVSNDAKRRAVGNYVKETGQEVKNGYSIELTIDQIIQYIAESELDAAYWKRKPNWTGIVVMKPDTGEILAMATRPTYNPNKCGSYPAAYRRNRLITDMFEPGSIFKTISCSGALNEGVVKYNDVFDCENGAFYIYRHTLNDCHPYGLLKFPQVIAYSSNIGTAKIAMKLGREKLHRYITDFGFGQKTGLPLLGESQGVFRDLKYWSGLSTVCIPMGQEICITGLQMIRAVSAIANEGKLMQPYLIKKIMDSEGNIVKNYEPHMLRQVITPKNAKIMNEALKMAVRKGGTGVYADIPEYTVAGKTGTAQKVENGRYSKSNYIGSFVGYAPADDPKIAIVAIMDSPKGEYYGGVVSAPIFREVARKVLKYMEVLPEPDRIPLSENNQSVGGKKNDQSG